MEASGARIAALTAQEREVEEKIKKIMMMIPNIIDQTEADWKMTVKTSRFRRYGEPVVPDFEIPYHAEIMGIIW